ncbi:MULTISPECIES: 4-oxalocrotonate tautomerase [unclassified Acinetobacter]|uniref:4-oxalocrotonate tautomerase n=1 Tax=unclassified Acinetobacter TaxID=196816 RepID=UPI0018AAAAA5|nr:MULTISPECIES: 4-oxalocrotonate tautomerase [unclassified Acinetobacter]MBJ9955325.1 4-oxalocrotonate tautomerase [Acinetobacter baumannii]
MPLINIELSPGRTHAQKKEFVKKVTKLTSEVLQCPIETIDVVFKEIPGYNWAHAGEFYSEPDK